MEAVEATASITDVIIEDNRRRHVTLLLSERHSALKLEKSAISKVQKSIICIFKNGKKSIFAPEKSLKLPKMQFLDWKKKDFW